MGALGPSPRLIPEVGFWRGSFQLKGHCFFIHSAKDHDKGDIHLTLNKLYDNDNKLLKIIFRVNRLVLFGAPWRHRGPGPGSDWGWGALRVRQIGSFLHTAPYGPEQKCHVFGMGTLGIICSPKVGLWVGKIHLKGHVFLHSNLTMCR